MMGRVLREYRRTDRGDVLGTLTRAFAIDPLFDWFARDLLHETRLLPGLMTGYVRDVEAHGSSHVWTDADDRARGYAGWLGPSALPRGARREALLTLRAGRSFVRARHLPTALRLLNAVESSHPHEPHRYLAVLGVDPTLQGRGHGRALLQPGLDAADDGHLPCYLETQKEANVPWYARSGFEVRSVVQVGSSPRVWCLWREPR